MTRLCCQLDLAVISSDARNKYLPDLCSVVAGAEQLQRELVHDLVHPGLGDGGAGVEQPPHQLLGQDARCKTRQGTTN